MDSEDEFNDFVLNELIDSPSSEDQENFYSDATNIIAHELHNHIVIQAEGPKKATRGGGE
jgi:hypothetical protein